MSKAEVARFLMQGTGDYLSGKIVTDKDGSYVLILSLISTE